MRKLCAMHRNSGTTEHMRLVSGSTVYLGMLLVCLLSNDPKYCLATETEMPPAASADMLTGVVTSNYGTSVQINKRNFTLHPAVVITDDEGRPRPVKDAVQGVQVKYHLKNDQVDRLIIVLMR